MRRPGGQAYGAKKFETPAALKAKYYARENVFRSKKKILPRGLR